MIFTRVERHWSAFIFHVSPRNSKSSWDCSTSKRSNLRGTPGASRIFCSVVADQLLANPPGYPPRKIVFKLKKNSLNGMVYLVNGYVFIQRRRSLYTKCIPLLRNSLGFSGWTSQWKAGDYTGLWVLYYFVYTILEFCLKYWFPEGSNHFLFKICSIQWVLSNPQISRTLG